MRLFINLQKAEEKKPPAAPKAEAPKVEGASKQPDPTAAPAQESSGGPPSGAQNVQYWSEKFGEPDPAKGWKGYTNKTGKQSYWRYKGEGGATDVADEEVDVESQAAQNDKATLEQPQTPSAELAEPKSPELSGEIIENEKRQELAEKEGMKDLSKVYEEKAAEAKIEAGLDPDVKVGVQDQAAAGTSAQGQAIASQSKQIKKDEEAKKVEQSRKQSERLHDKLVEQASRTSSSVDRSVFDKYMETVKEYQDEGKFDEAAELLKDAKVELNQETLKAKKKEVEAKKKERDAEAKKKLEESKKKAADIKATKDENVRAKASEQQKKAEEKAKADAEKKETQQNKAAKSSQKKLLDRIAKLPQEDLDLDAANAALDEANEQLKNGNYEGAQDFFEDADRRVSEAEREFKTQQDEKKQTERADQEEKRATEKQAAEEKRGAEKQAAKEEKQQKEEARAAEKQAAGQATTQKKQERESAQAAYQTGKAGEQFGEALADADVHGARGAAGALEAGATGTVTMGHHLLKDEESGDKEAKKEDEKQGGTNQSSLGKAMKSIPVTQIEQILKDFRIDLAHKDYSLQSVHRGAEEELEHTDDVREATKIALDHLEEKPQYYKRLDIAMEAPLRKLTKLGKSLNLYISDLNKAPGVSNGSSSSATDTSDEYQQKLKYNSSFASGPTGTQARIPSDDDPEKGRSWHADGETVQEDLEAERDENDDRAQAEGLVPKVQKSGGDFEQLNRSLRIIKAIRPSSLSAVEVEFLTTQLNYTLEDINKGTARITGLNRDRFSRWLCDRMHKSINSLR